MHYHLSRAAPWLLLSSLTIATSSFADATTLTNPTTLTEALKSGKVYGDIRVRYEAVNQDNALQDATALTARTRLGYVTGSMNGFSAGLEFEDSRAILSQDDYSVPPTGFKTGEYSVIADPQSSELDQAYLQYKSEWGAVKVGRQVIALDGQRFVGHVGWRQDRQTYDALSVSLTPAENVSLKYAYVNQRNRIFFEKGDIDSKDHLLNASYSMPLGKLSAFAYLLEVDNDVDNGLDTYGFSFSGKTAIAEGTKLLYALTYASQENSAIDKEADYYGIEGGLSMQGITAKLGYEVLGSDGGNYGFITPLATLHKFNGWSDQFLGTPKQGLVDVQASVSGKALGGKWVFAYHDFSADDGDADFGSEINLLFAKKFAKSYNAGIKYASYSAGDIKVDTDKLWIWVGASF